ncbi:Bax inhibitor-1/YccA family protein [Pseudoflavonifractor phocaeensis]|uniref:Bax inhibitor-1/YccA family protein n=1 Tax=Pseudoflavonifractor phocaeensis TaxID=1870988 RepID=UPI0025A42501|nr:Bax inhibitor-1/YccA family protein [Pseudoflavonifractor phocaeensis]MDM8237512.1 Bax inhibitor-1/YccA family protein [Pseudoflavonifractor phocaeensis]
MAFDPHELDRDYGAPSGVITEAQYTTRTFLWMMLGLLITFGVAILGWMTNLTLYLYAASPLVPIALGLVTLFMVITFSGRIEKMSVSSAQTLFVVFSIVMGITVSSWLYLFQLFSVVLVFLMTALYFGALAAYGHFTSRSLAGYRSILLSGLIFLLVFEILVTFIPGLSGTESVYCLIGIGIFLGYTAYDTQRIREFYYYYSGYPDMMEKASIFSALQLYLDFINLFLYLLRFLGRQRD